jgi:hypothetical protein
MIAAEQRASSNPGLTLAGQAANMRRARNSAQRQTTNARQAFDVLSAIDDAPPLWLAVLTQRINNPAATLRELASNMPEPMTKDAYAAHLRRALQVAGFPEKERELMTRAGTTTNFDLRDALLQLLSNGRATTTAELRTCLAEQYGFIGVTYETVYRHLDAMTRQQHPPVHRSRLTGHRNVYWTTRPAHISLGDIKESR